MIAACTPPKTACVPYRNSVERLLDEVLRWVPARSAAIAAGCGDATGEPIPLRSVRRPAPAAVPDCPCKLPSLKEAENRIRAEIDARVALSAPLAFDVISKGLDSFEKTTLLLAAVHVFGDAAAERGLWPIESAGTSTVVAETVWRFLGLAPQERLASLLKLLPTAPLMREGLIRTNYEPSCPADLACVGIELTGRGLAAITGVPDFENVGPKFEPPGRG